MQIQKSLQLAIDHLCIKLNFSKWKAVKVDEGGTEVSNK